MTTITDPLPKRIPGAALDQELHAASTDEPMTAERLAEISKAYDAATGGPWYFDQQYGPYFLASEVRGYMRGIGQLEFGDGKQADRDREFVLNSHAYVAELLDEVERLRGVLAGQKQASAVLVEDAARSWS